MPASVEMLLTLWTCALSTYNKMAEVERRARAWMRQTSTPAAARYWAPPRRRAWPPQIGPPVGEWEGRPSFEAAAMIVAIIPDLVGQVPAVVGKRGPAPEPWKLRAHNVCACKLHDGHRAFGRAGGSRDVAPQAHRCDRAAPRAAGSHFDAGRFHLISDALVQWTSHVIAFAISISRVSHHDPQRRVRRG